MHYLGGKYRLRKEIASILNAVRKDNQIYWEPFVGSAWVTTEVAKGPVFCSDANEYLIIMWNALLDGWIPPDNIGEDQYYYIKENPNESPALTAFAGFGCSWSGKWFGGYARDNTDRNYAENAKNSLLKKKKKLELLNPVFFTYDFLMPPHPFQRKECLIYCDPPYQGTTGYDAPLSDWSSKLFWEHVRLLTEQNHTIITSEYTAPDDFCCIAKFKTKTDLRTVDGKEERIEKLFVHKNIRSKLKDLNEPEQTELF